MTINQSHILPFLRRNSAVVLMMTVSCVGAFATLGDGNKGKGKTTTLLTHRSVTITPGKFSLKSNYAFRGNEVTNPDHDNSFVNLASTITFRKGNVTYILPMKQKVVLNKIRLNPNEKTDIRY
jgi:hypothetical protein